MHFFTEDIDFKAKIMHFAWIIHGFELLAHWAVIAKWTFHFLLKKCTYIYYYIIIILFFYYYVTPISFIVRSAIGGQPC